MGFRHALRFSFRAFFDRRRMDAEIDEELQFHLEAHVAELVRRGMPEPAARREAFRLFGGVARTRDDVRDAQGLAGWDALRQQLAHAVRTLRRAPGFAVMVALTLGLGIGANGAMFGIIDHLLLRGPAYVVHPDQLRRVYLTAHNEAGGARVDVDHPYALYTLLRDHASTLTGVAAYTVDQQQVGLGPGAHKVPVGRATAGLFPLLGAHPYLGRFFTSVEDQLPQGASVATVGYSFWVRELGGDSTVLGKSITIAGRRFTVIGVAPPGFTGAERELVDAWIPISTMAPNIGHFETTWFAAFLKIVGRLRPGISERAADAEATALLHAGADPNNQDDQHGTIELHPISYDDQGHEPAELGVARMLYGVALVVLLVAAANVANLLLARAMRRRREIAVRVALGASRLRVATMLLSEAAMLALLGGLAGVALAYWGGAIIRRTLLPAVAWGAPPVDMRVLIYTAAAVVATTLLIGLVPALRSTRGDPTTSLRTGTAQAGDHHRRTRALLQIGQVALSVVLLFTAGLFVRSLLRIRGLDLGLQPDRVLAAGIALPGPDRPPASQAEFQRTKAVERARFLGILDRVRRLSGVDAGGIAIGTPFYSSYGVGVMLPGHDSLPQAKGGGPFLSAVSPGYFAAVGTRLIRGRLFDDGDHEGSAPVLVVNQTMARTFWPGEDPIGKCLTIDETPCARVVGIVADARQWRLREDPPMQYYIPFGQEGSIDGMMLLVRPHGDAAVFKETLRAALARIAPDARFIEVKTLQESLDPQIRPWRVGAMMFGLFGLLALVVAAVGLFSVVSYLVTQRHHELGVRIALGARPPQIAQLVVGSAMQTAAIGTAIGILGSLLLAPSVQPLLFEVPARDPALLVVIALALLATTLIAASLPSWRATRVDPMTALRAD